MIVNIFTNYFLSISIFLK